MAVGKPEMPGFHVEYREMRLFKRPMVLTEHVRTQEIAVAVAQIGSIGRAGPMLPLGQRFKARPLTTPLGPLPQDWTIKRWVISTACRLRRRYGRADSEWLAGKFYGTNALGLHRWSEENQMGSTLYLAHLTTAILKGRGRWLGQIIT